MGSWIGRRLGCSFESGEVFFEDADDGKESEQSGFGNVVAVWCVFEQGSAHRSPVLKVTLMASSGVM